MGNCAENTLNTTSKDDRRTVTPNRISILAAAAIPLLLLVAAISSTGCSVYGNLTTYFNTFYNAQHLFDDAVNELMKAPQKDRDTNYFARYVVPPSTQSKFDSVVVKCSKIIQFHADSRYVDDALMMIGESYAYQNDAESAIKKFKELLTTFPESDLRFQARLWHAKTLYFDKKYDEAVVVAREAADAAAAGNEHDVQIEALMLQAQVAVDKRDFDLASDFYEKALQIKGDGSLLAMAAYQLGLAYEQTNKYDKAARTFRSVRTYSPDNNLRFKANTHHAMMVEAMGDHEIALKLFDDLKYDATKPEDKAALDLELAKTYTEMGDTARAFDFYRYMDTVYRSTPAVEKSYYLRGQLFETKYNDLKTALDYYRRTQASNANTAEGNIGRQKYAVFNHYFTVLNTISMYDSMLHPELHRKASDSTDSLGTHMRDSSGHLADSSSLAARTSMKTPDVQMPPSESREKVNSENPVVRPDPPQSNPIADAPPVKDTSAAAVGHPRAANPAANTVPNPAAKPAALPSLASGQQARQAENDEDTDESVERSRTVGRGRDVDDEIRKGRGRTHDVGPDTAGSAAQALGRARANLHAGSPVQSYSPDSLRKLISRSFFELAGIYYLELNLPDSAQAIYEHIVSDSLETPYRAAAIYALAEIRRTLNDTVATESLYNVVVDRYPRSEYANKVKKLRGLDTAGIVDVRWKIYNAAVETLETGNIRWALNHLAKMYADTTDTSQIAAKALYLAGWIYENRVVEQDTSANDSAAALYKQLVHRFPQSEYAADAQPKVAVKEDPNTLSQYVKIKEIVPISRPEKANSSKLNAKKAGEGEEDLERDEEQLKSRSPNRDVNEDTDDDSDDNSDDSGNN